MADIAEEYRSSLSELNFNSKPHINMLTMLAEENAAHAAIIVRTIVDHINSVTPDVKLPSLYLVDSIVKNIGKVYIPLFSKHLVSLFTSVFEKVDENIRSLLYKLRSTWTGIFPNTVLLQLDRSIVCLDPAWPILAKPQIHFNPKFLKEQAPVQLPQNEEPAPQNTLSPEVEMKKQELLLLQALHQKKKELIAMQLKAAIASPTATNSVKDDTKKTVNPRDPRLSKKMTAVSTGSDSTILQSVVIVPKGNVNKRNEKETVTTVSKKVKLDCVSNNKKDVKVKSNPAELESNSKLNVKLNNQDSSSKPVQAQKVDRNKKQFFNSENSNEIINKLPQQQNIDFEISQTNVNSLSGRSNELNNNTFVPKTSVTEENKYLFKPQPVMMTNEDTCHKKIQKLDLPPPPPPPLFLGNEDKDYRMLHKNVNERSLNESAYHKCPLVPVVKSFILDKKERKVYFVNNRSFALMDDNVPKELTFEGPPKLVFIEGLPQPIELAFGQEIKFEINGKYNFMKFGTPSREIYINDYPYEAQFGGPYFTAMLSDGEIHRIRINGPPPHVVLSESPAYELYEEFCHSNKEFLRRFDNEPSINNDNLSTDVSVGTRDVDMRINSMKFSSTFFSFPLEKMQDIDWQRVHVDNMKQTEWNVPKNSFESFKDIDSDFDGPRNLSKEFEWKNSLALSEMQSMTIEPPPLPPKQIINRFPLPFPTYRNELNKPLLPMSQFQMNEQPRFLPPGSIEQPRFTIGNVEQPKFLSPNSVPFSQSSLSNNEFSMNRPDLNMVKNCNIPRLSPPPLPPFIGPIQNANSISTVSSVTSGSIQNTSCIPTISSVITSGPFNNSVSPSSLHLPPVSTSLLNVPSFQPVIRLSAPLPMNNFTSNAQVPPYTVLENVPNFTSIPPSSTATTAVTSTTATTDMQLFMEKLKAAGLIKTDSSKLSTPVSTSTTLESEKKEDKTEDEQLKEEIVPEITFDSKCLKEYHSGIIAAIYSGSQCATCGMRFKEIQSEQYSRHLDWHFRRNRREKDGAKKPFSRRWFYEIKDWIEFKEFEDVDERAPSYFELQANSEQIEEVPENICSVSCSECDFENCAVCGEQFQLFWVEEEEEWHLRNAVKHDKQVYHPACYEDFKKANEPVTYTETIFDDSTSNTKSNTEEVNLDVEVKMEIMDDDVNIKTEVMDVDSELKEESIHTNDIAVKTDIVLNIKTEKVDSFVENETEELKLEEKLDLKNLICKDEDMQLTEQNQIKDEIKKELKIEEYETDSVKSQEVISEKDNKKVENNSMELVTTKNSKETLEITIDPKKCDKTEINVNNGNPKTDIVSSETNSNINPIDSNKTDEKTQLSSQLETVPIKSEDELENIEFRPPTPDPRFEVLPPVSRGTEISNLCVIM